MMKCPLWPKKHKNIYTLEKFKYFTNGITIFLTNSNLPQSNNQIIVFSVKLFVLDWAHFYSCKPAILENSLIPQPLVLYLTFFFRVNNVSDVDSSPLKITKGVFKCDHGLFTDKVFSFTFLTCLTDLSASTHAVSNGVH